MPLIFTTAEKAAIANAWIDARAAGERQVDFAARHEISTRRLREYVAEFGPVPIPIGRARRIIDEAIAQLKHLRAGLEQEEAARPPALHSGGKRLYTVPQEPTGAPNESVLPTQVRLHEGDSRTVAELEENDNLQPPLAATWAERGTPAPASEPVSQERYSTFKWWDE